ncbi:hypothetical protein EXN24_25640 [Rhizobium rhizogenes]|uniref:Transposase n=1 Tax=Rhizobium rhizogenes TaxID=359 RepID=A0AA94V8T2_RHIRH|nr:hypothetical protein EXN24_25640 [Rhizobium rhizogenes]
MRRAPDHARRLSGCEVSQRHGVAQLSLYEWKKRFGASNAKGDEVTEENRRLKKELPRSSCARKNGSVFVGGPRPEEGNFAIYTLARRNGVLVLYF